MIFSNAFPEVPILDVIIEQGTVPYSQIASVDLSFSENKHDMATITYAGFPGVAVTSYVGLPVKILLGNNEANLIQFTGYVAYVEIEARTKMGTVNDSLIQMAKVVCFGSSYEMKAIKNKTYEKKTIKQLTSIMAERYSFSYSVPDNTYVFPLLSQNEISDWEFLVSAANRIGYTVTAHGTHINVYDSFSSYFKLLSAIPLQTLNGDKGTERLPGNIYEFKGVFGQVTPEGNASNWVVKSLDNLGKEIAYSSTQDKNSGLGSKFKTKFVNEIIINTTTQDSLKEYVRKYTRESYPMVATASVIGVSNAMPGRLVNVGPYDSKFDGYWIIEEATHHINNQHYITTLKLKTDSTNEEPLVIGNDSIYNEAPDSILVNNLWKTEREFAHVY
jgi:phage protein D